MLDAGAELPRVPARGQADRRAAHRGLRRPPHVGGLPAPVRSGAGHGERPERGHVPQCDWVPDRGFGGAGPDQDQHVPVRGVGLPGDARARLLPRGRGVLRGPAGRARGEVHRPSGDVGAGGGAGEGAADGDGHRGRPRGRRGDGGVRDICVGDEALCAGVACEGLGRPLRGV